jgi:hypothetical protein
MYIDIKGTFDPSRSFLSLNMSSGSSSGEAERDTSISSSEVIGVTPEQDSERTANIFFGALGLPDLLPDCTIGFRFVGSLICFRGAVPPVDLRAD